MRNWQYYLDKIWNGGKLAIISTVVILIAYGLGTFKPNRYITKKIEYNQEQKIFDYFKSCEKIMINSSFLLTDYKN